MIYEQILKDYQQRAKDYLSEPESIVVIEWMEDLAKEIGKSEFNRGTVLTELFKKI